MEYGRFTNSIFSKRPAGRNSCWTTSLFNTRYICLTITRRSDENWETFSSRLNCEFEKADFQQRLKMSFLCVRSQIGWRSWCSIRPPKHNRTRTKYHTFGYRYRVSSDGKSEEGHSFGSKCLASNINCRRFTVCHS